MDSLFEDKGLSEYKSVKSDAAITTGPYVAGLKKLDVTHEEVVSVGSLLNSFYESLNSRDGRGRSITRNACTMLQGAVFALGTDTFGNLEWKEQSASSLREMMHAWDGPDNLATDYFSVYKFDDPNLKTKRKDAIKVIWNHYKFFSAYDHHDTSNVVFSLRAIRNDQNIKPEDSHTHDVFVEIFSSYVSTLNYLLAPNTTI